VTRTLEEQTRTLRIQFPSGLAFGAKDIPDSVFYQLLEGLAAELSRGDSVVAEFRQEILPDETTLFIDEWESAVGIPDTCLKGTGTVAERRRDVLAKLSSLGVQTAADFVALAALYGIDVIVKGGSVHGCFPFKFPIVFFPDERAARHTIMVNFDLPLLETFTYTFPITFGPPEVAVVECLFRKLKPANCDLMVVDFTL
jgi:uncharacterized protein YmfQ (DUF2313 family)